MFDLDQPARQSPDAAQTALANTMFRSSQPIHATGGMDGMARCASAQLQVKAGEHPLQMLQASELWATQTCVLITAIYTSAV